MNRSADRLRFSTAILKLLGEELNPSPDQGVIELVKNAYDADASVCSVELSGTHIRGGSIRVRDDGNGMSPEEIKNGWLIIGDSLKSTSTRSPGGRFLVGNKGLGRLGALRLGERVLLHSRPRGLPGTQFSVRIDWREFSAARVVEDVELAIEESAAPAGSLPGTDIEIAQLPEAWNQDDYRRLDRAMLLLRDPFSDDSSFRATLKLPRGTSIDRFSGPDLRSEAAFTLRASVDANGRGSAEVIDSEGTRRYMARHSAIAADRDHPVYRLPPCSFDLWEFNLSRKGFGTKQASLTELRSWLGVFGGVRLYHRGVRVLPYGEPKNDWLDMNLRRAQSPELRPSTNNSVGLIKIEDPVSILRQKTDRLGFVENSAFNELRRFAGDVLEWMAKERLKERETRRRAEVQAARERTEAADTKLSTAILSLSAKERRKVQAAVGNLKIAHEAEVRLKDETIHLYFTLGTVGTTAAAFAHQTKFPIIGIMQEARILKTWLGTPGQLALHHVEASDAANRIHDEAAAIHSFASVTLALLEHEKRRAARHAVHELIRDTVTLLQPYLNARSTSIECDFEDESPIVWCRKAAFEAIITNLLINALQAFSTTAGSPTQNDRRIQVRVRQENEYATIQINDNGPGIRDLAIDDIWVAGKTTTERGTGLGLAIVKDVVEELGGTVSAVAHGDLGGASFHILLPASR
jgi:signal transduction histidine kinase